MSTCDLGIWYRSTYDVSSLYNLILLEVRFAVRQYNYNTSANNVFLSKWEDVDVSKNVLGAADWVHFVEAVSFPIIII